MTRDDIIRMMNESCDPDKVNAWGNGFWTITQDELERFAKLVAAAEREACAKIFDRPEWNEDVAQIIRARSQQ